MPKHFTSMPAIRISVPSQVGRRTRVLRTAVKSSKRVVCSGDIRCCSERNRWNSRQRRSHDGKEWDSLRKDDRQRMWNWLLDWRAILGPRSDSRSRQRIDSICLWGFADDLYLVRIFRWQRELKTSTREMRIHLQLYGIRQACPIDKWHSHRTFHQTHTGRMETEKRQVWELVVFSKGFTYITMEINQILNKIQQIEHGFQHISGLKGFWLDFSAVLKFTGQQ